MVVSFTGMGVFLGWLEAFGSIYLDPQNTFGKVDHFQKEGECTHFQRYFWNLLKGLGVAAGLAMVVTSIREGVSCLYFLTCMW